MAFQTKQFLHSAWAYVKYLYKGNSAHSIHSPFVFELYNKAIKKKPQLPLVFPEKVRTELLCNKNVIELVGFGAGSKSYSVQKIEVKKHAKHSLKGKKESELLYHILKSLAPATILELGTSFGVSTLYLSEAVPTAQITTLEGEKAIQEIANHYFTDKNITSTVGNIDQLLPELLKEKEVLDCVVFDANHRYEPTMRYFKACLENITNDSFFIIDDIYWSQEMTKAWQEIKSHPRVKISIDLYHFGLVFFRKEQLKEHFILRQFQLIS